MTANVITGKPCNNEVLFPAQINRDGEPMKTEKYHFQVSGSLPTTAVKHDSHSILLKCAWACKLASAIIRNDDDTHQVYSPHCLRPNYETFFKTGVELLSIVERCIHTYTHCRIDFVPMSCTPFRNGIVILYRTTIIELSNGLPQVQPKRLMLHMPHTDLVGSRATAHKYSTRERWAQGLERFRPQGLDRTGLLQSSILRSALRHTATLGVGVLIGWKLHSRRGTR